MLAGFADANLFPSSFCPPSSSPFVWKMAVNNKANGNTAESSKPRGRRATKKSDENRPTATMESPGSVGTEPGSAESGGKLPLDSPEFRPIIRDLIRLAKEQDYLTFDDINEAIPDTATEKPVQGKVIAVGNGKILEDGKVRPLDVQVGDKILFGKYGGQEVKVDGEELLVMREEDVMAVIEGK